MISLSNRDCTLSGTEYPHVVQHAGQTEVLVLVVVRICQSGDRCDPSAVATAHHNTNAAAMRRQRKHGVHRVSGLFPLSPIRKDVKSLGRLWEGEIEVGIELEMWRDTRCSVDRSLDHVIVNLAAANIAQGENMIRFWFQIDNAALTTVGIP